MASEQLRAALGITERIRPTVRAAGNVLATGPELTTLRLALGITQAQLAQRLGITAPTVSGMEAGHQFVRNDKPYSPTLKAMFDKARELGVLGRPDVAGDV